VERSEPSEFSGYILEFTWRLIYSAISSLTTNGAERALKEPNKHNLLDIEY
jgi:hypothetical protein